MRVATLFLLAILAGCAAGVPPLKHDAAANIKRGKTAVLFCDDVQQINYIGDKYFVLGVAQIASNSVYKGVWDSNKDLSAVHAAGLARAGLQARSVFELLPPNEVAAMIEGDRARFVFNPPKPAKGAPPPPPPLSQEFRDALINKGQDYLIWIGWSGFTLHVRTLGLSTLEQFSTGFWIVDLKSNQVTWHGFIGSFAEVHIGDQSGRDFLERDDLRGLKSEASMRINERYSRGGKAVTYGQIIGLEDKT